MKLFVLGNGFDLHHNLPTTTSDFTNCIDKYDYPEYYMNSGVDWNLYEEGLSYFDVDTMSELHIEGPDYLSDRESDRDGVILQMKQKMVEMLDIRDNALKEMINIANQKIHEISHQVKSSDAFYNSLVLSFNYTSTLEQLYSLENIKDVLYIHGFFYDDDDLIFGYSEPNEDVLKKFYPHDVDGNNNFTSNDFYEEEHDDYYIQNQYQLMYDYYCSNQKTHQIEKLNNWLKSYEGEVEEIIVLGHSMGLVDKPYFELLEEILNPARWRISRYKNSPSDEDIQNYSFYSKVDHSYCNISSFVSLL